MNLESRHSRIDESLASVLPHKQRSTNVHVERTHETLLWNFHACVQKLDELHWKPFLLVAARKNKNMKLNFTESIP